MTNWASQITDRITRETHFGREGLKCFADRPANLNDMLQQAVDRNAGGEALVCDDVRLSYEGLDAQVGAVAAGLAAHGVQQGDRVALVSGNTPEFLIVLMAALRLAPCCWSTTPMSRPNCPRLIRSHRSSIGFA